MDYAGPKPKFCSSCGSPVGVAKKHGSKPLQGNSLSFREQMEARKEGDTVLSEDETDIEYVPDIKGLEYDITPAEGFGHKIYNFEDVVNVATQEEPKQEKPKKRRGRPRKKRN